MPRARFYKTLFIPGIEGQYNLWKHELLPIVAKVDEIVQMGNLIGCSPRMKDREKLGPNISVLNYVALWRSTFSNWTQLVGPNEIMALNFPDEWTNTESNRILRRRWLEGEENRFQVASVSKGRLVTHGGLSHGQWVEIGRPETAEEAARLLNEKFSGSLSLGRAFRLGQVPNFSVDPVFADPVREVYPSWITAPDVMPFGQMHSGGGINTPEGREALTAPFSLLTHVQVKYLNFGSLVELPQGGSFISISPELPQDRIVKYLEMPWRFYIEKTPVVDLRDELFVAKN